MSKHKTNPNNVPATQADVKRARNEGIKIGVTNSSAIFLTVLADKFAVADYIADIWAEINKLSEEVAERRVSIADLRKVLLEEYGVEV